MSSLSPSVDTVLRDPVFPRLKAHLVESTGLAYYADKDHDLARRVARRLATAGISNCASYFELLRDPLRGPAELDELIAEITIGETYFFRHREHFDALRDQVFPDLLLRNRLTRSVRIWCAGCADGPEPYSLAILLKREMAGQLSGWDVTILGTDINRRSLACARDGRFENWAFRATPDNLKHECFYREGSLWSLGRDYRRGVSFQYHNLVEHPFPSLVQNLSAFDLIICRNVMIYFGSELRQRMIERFYQCLVPGAWLLVGPTEPNMTCFTSFRSVSAPGLTLYQKPADPAPDPNPLAAAFESKPLPPLPLSMMHGQEAAISPAVRKSKLERRLDAAGSDAVLAKARSHADRGEWEAAERCCEDVLSADSLNSRGHFYQGLILEQMRKHSQAEQSLRRAIYLDRQSVLAHYYLGLALQARGQSGQAARCFENTLRLLDSTSRSHRFLDADEITAGELGGLASIHLEILRERICNVPA